MRLAARSAFGRRTLRKGIFARIIEALHVSRRVEATRLLRRHRYLIAEQLQRPLNGASPVLDIAEESRENVDRNQPLIRANRRTFQNA